MWPQLSRKINDGHKASSQIDVKGSCDSTRRTLGPRLGSGARLILV